MNAARAALLVAGATLLLLPGGSTASPRPLRPAVVFQTDWVPGYRTADLYVIPAHGGPRRALTRNELDDVHPTWSPDGKKLLFARAGDLYTMSPKGGRLRRLTRTALREVDAAWSPDGRRIAFEGGREGREQIYVMNADGSDRRRITSGRSCAKDPGWAGDGRIVLSACSGETSLLSVRDDGTDPRPIMSNSPGEEADYQPAVSPDGRRIVFTRTVTETNGTELWLAAADGTRPRRVLRDGAQGVWSPDGRRIAFVHGPHFGGNDEIGYGFSGGPKVSVINANGTGLRHLTPQPEFFYGGVSPSPGWRWSQSGIRILGLSWSPDGRSLAYGLRLERRRHDIASVDGGSALRRLSANRRSELQPTISTDGSRVAFLSVPNVGAPSLYVMSTAGGPWKRLAREAWNPAWSLDGQWLAYEGRNGIRIVHLSGRPDALVATETPWRFVWSPAWSADGRHVLYLGKRRGGRRTAIWRVARSGTEARRVGVLPLHAGDLDWSPDRRLAVFNRIRRLYVMHADGSGVRALGRRYSRELATPAWCGDGRTIVYAARRDGDWDLYAITRDGRDIGKLTDNLADDYAPDC